MTGRGRRWRRRSPGAAAGNAVIACALHVSAPNPTTKRFRTKALGPDCTMRFQAWDVEFKDACRAVVIPPEPSVRCVRRMYPAGAPFSSRRRRCRRRS